MADAIKNFAKVTVDGLYDASATEITLKTGDGAKLPNPSTDGEFNLVWWNADDYPDPADDPNVEIVRCTGRSTDTLTVTRNQEGSGASTKNTTGKTYKMILGVTKKSMDDKSEVGVASGQIAALAEKTTPVDDDLLIVEDSAATNAPKKVKMSNLPGGGMEDPMTTSGDMIYRGSTQPARLPKGSLGQILTMGASYPAWATPAAKGITASDTVIVSADTERLTNSTSFVKLKEFRLVRGGIYRIKFDGYVGSGGGTGKAEIRNSAGGVLSAFDVSATSYATYSSDIAFVAAGGELVSIWFRQTNAGSNGGIKNAKACGTESTITDAATEN